MVWGKRKAPRLREGLPEFVRAADLHLLSEDPFGLEHATAQFAKFMVGDRSLALAGPARDHFVAVHVLPSIVRLHFPQLVNVEGAGRIRHGECFCCQVHVPLTDEVDLLEQLPGWPRQGCQAALLLGHLQELEVVAVLIEAELFDGDEHSFVHGAVVRHERVVVGARFALAHGERCEGEESDRRNDPETQVFHREHGLGFTNIIAYKSLYVNSFKLVFIAFFSPKLLPFRLKICYNL